MELHSSLKFTNENFSYIFLKILLENCVRFLTLKLINVNLYYNIVLTEWQK